MGGRAAVTPIFRPLQYTATTYKLAEHRSPPFTDVLDGGRVRAVTYWMLARHGKQRGTHRLQKAVKKLSRREKLMHRISTVYG